MMSLLNNGRLQKLIGEKLGSPALFGEPAELLRRDPQPTTIDADGNPVATFKSHKITATPLDISAHRRSSDNVPDTDVDLLLYQYNAPVAPLATDRVTVRGTMYTLIAPITADPAAATWTCRARRLT